LVYLEESLRGIDLSGANLVGADLRWANLNGVKLNGAKLNWANLRGAKNLTCEQFKTAKDWQSAYRDEKLGCGADIPIDEE
jgi:uncharacterized protein YjbI with pentapeptide repeats